MTAIDRFLPPKKKEIVIDWLGRKVGVFVPACWHYRFRADLCRKVWVPRCERMGIQVIFYDEGEDTTIYKTRGDWQYNLTAKIKRMLTHAYENNFDHIIKVDSDAEFWPERLNFSDMLSHDYIGNHQCPYENEYNYANGSCYILSRKMLHKIALTDIRFNPEYLWGEDVWIGKVAHYNKIPLHMERRIVWDQPYDPDKFLAWHDFGKYMGKQKGCPYLAENESFIL